jgi:phytoene dehydrogenase-like protein
MSKHIVVVGGGLGGLSAAVHCAQNGHSVTLFEKQAQTGGYATSFTRSGFVFDPALHAVPAGGAGDPFERLMQQLGVGDRVAFLRINQGFCARLGSSTFRLDPDFNVLFSDLAGAFPADREGLRRLSAQIMKYAPLYYSTVEGNLSAIEIATRFVPRIPLFLHHAAISTRDYLARFVKNQTLAALLYHPAIFYGIPMASFPAVNFMIMFYLIFAKGMFTIAGGGRALSAALEQRFAALGGRVVLRTEVSKIRLRNGRAVAVETSDNNVVDADAVICNVNTPFLVNTLIDGEHFPGRYLRTLRSLKPSLSVLQLHLGLDCAIEETGIDSHITTLFPDADIDTVLSKREGDLVPRAFSIIAPSLTDPDAAPPGKSVLSLLGGVSADRWFSLTRSEYNEEKKRCTGELMSNLDRWYPSLSAQCRVIDCATPRTFERYTGNPNGAILGFDCSLGTQRNIMSVSRLPIRNLHLAGAWTGRLGGFMQAVKAGVSAAEQCIRSAGA